MNKKCPEKFSLSQWKHLPQYANGDGTGLYCTGCLVCLNYFDDDQGRCPRCVAYEKETGVEVSLS